MNISKNNNTMTTKALYGSMFIFFSLCATQENKENDKNEGNAISSTYAKIVTMVTKKNFNINRIKNGRTPLTEYIFNEKNPLLNADILQLFFAHGAAILSPEPKSSNSLYAILKRPDLWSVNDKVIAMATLLKERLAPLKDVYNDRLFYFCLLNKVRTQKKLVRIPKPLLLLVTSLSIQQESPLIDIARSINHEQAILRDEIMSSDILSKNKELLTMIATTFWDRTPKECLQDLDNIIITCVKKEKERLERLSDSCRRFVNLWKCRG